MLAICLSPVVRLSTSPKANHGGPSWTKREGEDIYALVRRFAGLMSPGYLGFGHHGVGYFGESYGPPFTMVMRFRRYCFPPASNLYALLL